MTEEAPRPVRLARDRLWWAAVFLVALLYGLTVPRTWQCEGVDEIEYLHLAHSLDRGWGYRLEGKPYGLYPPAFPIILGLLMREGEIPWRLLYTVNAWIGLAGLVVLAAALRRHGGEAGLWASWFSLGSYYAWSFSTRFLLAEPLAVFASAVALAAMLEAQAKVRRSLWIAMALAALAVAVLTKASAIALTAAMSAACMVTFLKRRDRCWLVAALAVALLGFGLQMAWEWRAVSVASSSEETYLRWMLRILGLSDGGGGIVARNAGEGVAAASPIWERAAWLWVSATRQMLSVVRAPDNLGPLAALLAVLFGIGIARGAAHRMESPLPALCVLSLVMFSATRWVSSYPRYLYTIAPLLFHFVIEGVLVVRDARSEAARRLAASVVLGAGVWGLIASAGAFGGVTSGGEGAYVRALRAGLAALYAAMSVSGAWGLYRGAGRELRPVVWRTGLAAILAATSIHSLAIAAARFRLTLGNETLRMRNLTGAVEAGRWISAQTDSEAVVVTSFPRLATFLANRRAVAEFPLGAASSPVVVLLLGDVREVPAFRAPAETALAQLVRSRGARVVFSAGDAAVLRASNDP